MTKSLTIGSRRQVWNGTAKKTSGGLTKSDLIMSHGRIVSRSKHFSAKKEMRLLKYGYGTKKGKFGFVRTKKHRRGRKMKGGHANVGAPMSHANADGTPASSAPYSPGSANISTGGRSRSRSRSRSIGRSRGRGMAGGGYGSASWSRDNLLSGGRRRRRRHRR